MAVSAKGRPDPSSLCASEGKGKPKKQCVNALKKLDKGKAANPRAACKGMSKKKTKGVRGKSPFAVCVSAAAKLMAAKAAAGSGGGNGSANANSGSGSGKGKSGNSDSSGADDEADSADDDSPSEQDGIVCHDVDGNVVPIDSDDVADCDIPDDAGASSDDSSSTDDSGDSPDDSGDGE